MPFPGNISAQSVLLSLNHSGRALQRNVLNASATTATLMAFADFAGAPWFARVTDRIVMIDMAISAVNTVTVTIQSAVTTANVLFKLRSRSDGPYPWMPMFAHATANEDIDLATSADGAEITANFTLDRILYGGPS